MKVYPDSKNIIKCWSNNPEDGAIEQAKNIANFPFIHHHVALMPDVHQGYGVPIGGVVACENVIIINAVGVDIGCGMRAIKTNINCNSLSTKEYKKIMSKIRQTIPLGKNHHKEETNWFDNDVFEEKISKLKDLTWKDRFSNLYYNESGYQSGTLGGGNHFIELQKDEEGYIWAMIHSGSRNFGYKVAKYFSQKVYDICKNWYIPIPTYNYKKEDNLAYCPAYSDIGKDYLISMNICLDFAKISREKMIKNVFAALFDIREEVSVSEEYDVHHNYVSLENHFNKNVWVHRKGATSAKKDEIGIIPGSQGTCSYITIGKGNKESFMSSSHGAGRKMSRKKARNELNLTEEISLLENKNIIHSLRNQKNLDEAPSAYKNIDEVMEEQKDIVDIKEKLSPILVIKEE